MEVFLYRVSCFLLIISSLSTILEVKSQSGCRSVLAGSYIGILTAVSRFNLTKTWLFFHLDNLTNGVTAELITSTDGLSLLGIKVSWKIKSVYLKCSFSSMRVKLRSGANRLQRDITVNDTSTEFYDTICM